MAAEPAVWVRFRGAGGVGSEGAEVMGLAARVGARREEADSRGNDRKNGKGKARASTEPGPVEHEMAQGQRTGREGAGSRLLGWEEVALIEEAGGLGVGLGLEDEAGAQGFWLGFDRRGRGGDGFGMVGGGGLR